MREMEDVKDKIALFQDRVISEEDVLKKYRFDTEDVILCSRKTAGVNGSIDCWNNKLKAICPENQLKIRYTRSTKTNYCSERLLNQQILLTNQALGFAATIHAYQGTTFYDNIFISLE